MLSILFATFAFALPSTTTPGLDIQDQCSFIRAGLNAIPATGGEFVVPQGNYTCTYPIVLDRDGQRLRGQGQVTLKLADNTNAPVIVMGDIITPPRQVHNVMVSNIRIDGNRAHQQIECWGGPCDSSGTAHIRNNGITVRGITNGVIRNVAITGPRSGGVVTEKGCMGLLVDGLSVTDSHFDGFAGYETTGSTIKNLYFHDNMAAGISIDIRFHNNTFQNVRMENNRDVGIFMRDSNDNLFQDFWIVGAGNHGVFVALVEEEHTCPKNNEFRNFTIENSKRSGFRLNNACENNRLTGVSTFRHNKGGCISEGRSARLGIEGTYICEE